MKKRFSIRVLGRVQGVWFRKSTKEKADELGVVGLVRNEVDGSVYIEAEGEKEIIEAFIAWCHSGSEQSEVKQVITQELAPRADTEFLIQY